MIKYINKLLQGLPILVLACSEVYIDYTPSDAGTDASQDLGTTAQPLVYPLGFGRYAGSSAGRTKGELWGHIECAVNRIVDATCLPIYIDSRGPNYVRWNDNDELNGSTGRALTPWSASRIHVNESLEEERVCTILVHEIIHVLRRSTGHGGLDGAMSYPVVHFITPPVSKITAGDINSICAVQDCTCAVPE
jgi:hypothetical protein